LEKLAAEKAVGDRIQFVERQPAERMPALMAAADALLVSLKKSELSKYVIPSKTVAYLASGKPVLMATGGASEDLINQAEAGIAVEPENADQLANAIEHMQKMSPSDLSDFGERGRQFLVKNLSKKKVIADYELLLTETAAKYKK
jgi:glycosyltransferase involved in cell wall biosynthesis